LLLRPVDVVEVLLLVGELVMVTVELERHVDKVLSSGVRTLCKKENQVANVLPVYEGVIVQM
jgi:hypothetical protein